MQTGRRSTRCTAGHFVVMDRDAALQWLQTVVDGKGRLVLG
jgi:hypothetical protein